MTVEALPTSYTFGKVVGRVLHAIADTSDDIDEHPEARAAAGTVVFTPAETLRKVVDVDAVGPAFITNGPVVANLSATGRILDAEGRQGVWLVTGVYTVAFQLTNIAGVGSRPTIPAFDIEVTAAHDEVAPLDLAVAAPYTPPTGVEVVTYTVPDGGTTGQVLAKASNAHGDVAWTDPATGGTADHGALTGLTDDDHPQYALADGTRGSFAATAHTHTADDVSDATVVGKALVRASSATAGRAAIGAGTSDLQLGVGPTTAAAGDHTHDGRYYTETEVDTALAGKAATAHTHPAADISDSTATGRSVVTAADAAAARTAIGAGTSSLALGTTSSTAKAGDYTPPLADLPAGVVLAARWTGAAWPSRPTARTDLVVHWMSSDPAATNPPPGALSVDLITIATS